MSEDRERILIGVFSDIFENQAFMFSERLEEDAEWPGPSLLAEIDFRGPFSGSLSMAIPVELACEAAANMLGSAPEDELAEHQIHDAVKELLNVACGHVLTTLAGDEPVFDLAVPSVVSLDELDWAQYVGREGCAAMSVEDSPVVVRLVTLPS